MSSPIAASAHLSLFLPFLNAWVDLAHQRTAMAPPTSDPWWMSVEARMCAFEEAATRTGWSVRLSIDLDAELWDMHLQQDGQQFAVRCVAAMQSIASDDNGRTFLENARRLTQLEDRRDKKPPSETGLHVLFVMPYLRADEGNDDEVTHRLGEWLASSPFQAAAHAWVGATAPVLRNAAGWAFPGIGLLMQPLHGRWATS
jgi:hypothetical protein